MPQSKKNVDAIRPASPLDYFWRQEQSEHEPFYLDHPRPKGLSALRPTGAELKDIIQVKETPSERFHRLAGEWKEQSVFLSSVSSMAILPPYQAIIGMGPEAVPLILRELIQEPDHWFWALQAITDANPVKAEEMGNLEKMAKAWIKWGQDSGLLND